MSESGWVTRIGKKREKERAADVQSARAVLIRNHVGAPMAWLEPTESIARNGRSASGSHRDRQEASDPAAPPRSQKAFVAASCATTELSFTQHGDKVRR